MKKNIFLISFFLILIFVFLLIFYNTQEKANNFDYPIEYSRIECLNDTPVIGFFNPNETSYENIILKVPNNGGVNIYEVDEELYPNKTEVLFLINSSCSVKQENIELFWCADNCFSTFMIKPSKDIELEMG